MNKLIGGLFLLFAILIMVSCASHEGKENVVIQMKTTMGDMKISLYDGTPLHRDNFIKLISSGFYEGISFHRVINSFMIQAGDPVTRSVPVTAGADTLNNYTIPAEFNPSYFHRKGALAAAREGNNTNPDMRSSGTQFYIVQGQILSDDELALSEQRINSNIRQGMFNKLIRQVADSAAISGKPLSDGEVQELASSKMFMYLSVNPEYKIPEEQKTVYKSVGGVPRLDQTYTVFGEVIEGLEIIDKIAAVQTNEADKPIEDVKILRIRIISK